MSEGHQDVDQPLMSNLDERGVLQLSMNRPAVHNAFDDAQIARLSEALAEVAENPAVKCLVLSGEGRHFCAGADLNYMRRMGDYSYEDNLADGAALAKLMRSLDSLPLPTIAKVQGAAYGGAVGLISCCDIAIAADNAKLCLSEVKIGMAPATISPYVVRAMGSRQARRYGLSAELMDANCAQRLGLLHEVVAVDALDARVEAMISQLLGNGPAAMATTKAMIARVAAEDIDQAMRDDTVRCIADVRDSDEGREGLSAFLQKRKPSWLST